jgi:hypothetical protein
LIEKGKRRRIVDELSIQLIFKLKSDLQDIITQTEGLATAVARAARKAKLETVVSTF